MPSTATITAYYSFTPYTGIKSAEVNANFANHRGHQIPINTDTATTSNLTHDLGSIDHSWRGIFGQYAIMYANTTSSIPTPATSTAYALYFKNDGKLYSKTSGGTESEYKVGNIAYAATTGGMTLSDSNDAVIFTGNSSSTFTLPAASGRTGKTFTTINMSDTTSTMTIDGNGSETIGGSTTNVLNYKFDAIQFFSDGVNWLINACRKSPTVQKFTSGTGTYTTPVGVKFLVVTCVGGGGGGSGSATTAANNGGSGSAGGNTTFGSSLLSANGGSGATGASAAGYGGSGGSASLGTGPIGIALTGSKGGAASVGNVANAYPCGGVGGSTPLQGAGQGGPLATGGDAAVANSGSAGGGGGSIISADTYTGAGGGSGGYVRAIIPNPLSSYSYAVGSGGSGGSAGTSGTAGGAGAAGIIIVEEYY